MTTMRKVLFIALGVALVGMCVPALAQCPGGGKVWDDLSWWGQSGATPEPMKDAARSGYWWWPTAPSSNAGDAEAWGNRGVVYGPYEKPAPPAPPATAPPTQTAKVERQIPTFSHVLFEFDKSTLKPEGKVAADEVVAWLKKYSKDTVVIEGHTCNIGTDLYNTGLGQRRADAVMAYLVEAGIDKARVSSVSYGESQPAVANDTPANRKLNRRAVFKITIVD